MKRRGYDESAGDSLQDEARAIEDVKDSPRLTLWPLPDQRHLYMLVAGVVLGLLLGPTVLGRFAPQQYDQLFDGSGDTTQLEAAQQDMDDFITDNTAHAMRVQMQMKKYEDAGLDPADPSVQTAMAEDLRQINDARDTERLNVEANLLLAKNIIDDNRLTHREKLLGMATVMLLLIVILHAAESILSPQRDEIEQGKATLPPVLARLITVRYGLAAGWLMLMLAQPIWLRAIDPWFGGLLLAVVLIVGLVPLGKRQTK